MCECENVFVLLYVFVCYFVYVTVCGLKQLRHMYMREQSVNSLYSNWVILPLVRYVLQASPCFKQVSVTSKSALQASSCFKQISVELLCSQQLKRLGDGFTHASHKSQHLRTHIAKAVGAKLTNKQANKQTTHFGDMY